MAKAKKEMNLLLPIEKQPYSIPENWVWVSVGAINNYKASSVDPMKSPDTIFELYSVPSSAFDYPEIVQGADIGSTKQSVQKGDVLLCKINPRINRVWNVAKHTDNTLLASSEWIVVRNQRINPLFLMYYFRTKIFREFMLSNVSGVGGSLMRAQPKFVKDYPVPIAPLEEQQRIVDRIESLFAKLDEAKEKAQAVVEGYEQRKAAILHQAFTGELTNVWRRQNGINATSWIDCELMDVLRDRPRNGYSPKPVSYVTPYKSMTLSATTSGEFLPEHFKYIDEEIPADSYLWLEPGDILVQRANSLEKVGTSAIYTGSSHEFIYPDLIMKLQVKEGIMPEYIAYQLKTSSALSYMRGHATGTAGNMPKINQKIVSSVPIKMTTYEVQREIVRILREILGKEQQVKEVAETVIAQIDAMKKSILARAFRGELGTNDPTDESAEVLLKNIL